nr:uncharacterized protein LOC104097453 [Nicotiana tomentosiformis]
MKMWLESNNPPVEPPEVKSMRGIPKRCRRKEKDEPRKKKWGKASKKGAKMTCSNCHQIGHNKKGCKSGPQERPRTTIEATPNSQHTTQQSSTTTEAMPMRQPSTQHSSIPYSLYQDTTRVRNNTSTGRGRGRRLGIGVGRGKGRGTAIGRGTTLGRGRGLVLIQQVQQPVYLLDLLLLLLFMLLLNLFLLLLKKKWDLTFTQTHNLEDKFLIRKH